LELLRKHTDEKNISIAEMGYKIFFSSATLTLNSKPMAGLKTNRKPVVGLNQKNCQLFLGRYTFFKTNFIATAQVAHLALPDTQADPSQSQKSHFFANPHENCYKL
jgi:hypothetical protein